MISFELMHPYNNLNMPKIVKLGRWKITINSKYLIFNANFDIWRSVQMTWTRHYFWMQHLELLKSWFHKKKFQNFKTIRKHLVQLFIFFSLKQSEWSSFFFKSEFVKSYAEQLIEKWLFNSKIFINCSFTPTSFERIFSGYFHIQLW